MSRSGDESPKVVWQPTFYLTCAVSVAIMMATVYVVTPRTWTTGFIVGYGVASVPALLFLAVQHWSLRPREVSVDG